ncbi:thioredoxin reductase [Mycetocola sp. CAN_C7]|uniref:NAD(P)/FAD-dependent oxidoreductase n=1 Tax=Mycetocola sp. CAN_C7 TaxID=2787724 RepID=UPI001A2A7F7E
MTNHTTPILFDAVIVGGGAAGLSAATALGRSRRSAVVIDAGEPRNAPASGVHNFLTRDGTPPAELMQLGRAEVEGYGGTIIRGTAISVERTDAGFAVTTDDGDVIAGRRLIVTTGLVDELPNIPGLRERWGRNVLHCPYCHGWEVRDHAIGILATGPAAMHQAMMFRQLSDRVTVFLHQAPEPTDDELDQLAALGIDLVRGRVASVEASGTTLSSVTLEDGSVHPIEELVVAPIFTARSELLESLGAEVTTHPMGMGSFIEADEFGATSVPGVWAAGNVTDLMGQVVTSAAQGLRAGAAVNGDLILQEARDAVTAYRATRAEALVE